MCALSCGMVAVGTCNAEVTSTILQIIIEKSQSELEDTYARFLALGLGLTYLGRQESVDAVLAALQVAPEPFKSMACTLVDVCAYAGETPLGPPLLCLSKWHPGHMDPMVQIAVVWISTSGTGNVLKVQHLLHICSEHYEAKDQVGSAAVCLSLSLPEKMS